MTTTTSKSSRRITTQLLLLWAVFQQSHAHTHSLRATKDHAEQRPRKAKLPKSSKTAVSSKKMAKVVVQPEAKGNSQPQPQLLLKDQDYNDLDYIAQHPRDLLDIDSIDEASIQNRVVGGSTVTDYNKHPFFAEWFNQFCGGALIHDDLVLTAAHCDNAGGIARKIYFRNIQRAESGSVVRTITEHVTHPKFNAQYSTRDYDYMLLKLDKSALVDDYGNPTGVQVININTDPSIPATNDKLWGIGYGQIGENIGGMSTTLQDATIHAFSNQTCENQYQQYFEQDYMFCSGVAGGGTDTCQGDSGGPIVHKATNTLVGVVSFGIGCARANYAGVNARVSAASEWLLRSMCDWSNYKKCGGSYAPTPAPTPQPTGAGNSNNAATPGSVTISFTYDDYPEELSWTLQGADKGAGKSLKFQPWDTLATAQTTTSDTFTGLTQGVTYNFKLADSEGDGICCGYGMGQITIYDNVKGENLWASQGNFGPYYEIDFIIQGNGRAKVKSRSAHYVPSSWPDYEKMLAPSNEPFWPGRLPDHNASSIMINVDTDDYPEELAWELHRLPRSNNPVAWSKVESWNGKNANFRELVSVEVNNLSRGWYRFVVTDSEGDGNCCEYGDGYISLTGPLAVNQGEKGLVWGNDGKFWSRDEVFFYMENGGYISQISLIEATVSQQITSARQGITSRTAVEPTPESP